MRVESYGVAVDGPHGRLLAPTSLSASTGTVTLVAGPPGAGHTALALALAGRLRPHAGEVRLDGVGDPSGLRRRVALVDVPGVSEPDDVLHLATVVGEELAMAGHHAGRSRVRAWLADQDGLEWGRTRIEDLPGDVRVRLMADLAALRPGIGALVLTCPDRYGASAEASWAVARRLADHDVAVVLQLMGNTALVLDEEPYVLGEEPT